jgi:hypothetical protein
MPQFFSLTHEHPWAVSDSRASVSVTNDTLVAEN